MDLAAPEDVADAHDDRDVRDEPQERHHAEHEAEREQLENVALPPLGTNCGRKLVKKTAIFGFERLLSTPCRSDTRAGTTRPRAVVPPFPPPRIAAQSARPPR